jgi:hypothetical protein
MRSAVRSARAPLPSRADSEETSRTIDRAVRNIVSTAFDKAKAVLTERREILERGAPAAPREGNARGRGSAGPGQTPEEEASDREGDGKWSSSDGWEAGRSPMTLRARLEFSALFRAAA